MVLAMEAMALPMLGRPSTPSIPSSLSLFFILKQAPEVQASLELVIPPVSASSIPGISGLSEQTQFKPVF